MSENQNKNKSYFKKIGYVENEWFRNVFSGIAVQLKEIETVGNADFVTYLIIGRSIKDCIKRKPFYVFEKCYTNINAESKKEGFIVKETAFSKDFEQYYRLAKAEKINEEAEKATEVAENANKE